MVHVLLLPSWYPQDPSDVAGVFFRDQALALSEACHRVGVVAVNMRSLLRGRASGASQAPVVQREDDAGVITYRDAILAALPRIPYGNYWLWQRAATNLLHEYVASEGWPDIVHAHCAIHAGAVAACWRRRYGLPFVLTEHSSAFARGTLDLWQLRLAERAASEADARVAVSPNLRGILAECLPGVRGGWRWIPNLVAKRFRVPDAPFDERRRPVRFLNLALMTENKGQMDLLKAFSLAFGERRDVEVWFGGDGPLKRRLEAEAKSLGIAEQVHFLGRVSPEAVPGLLQEVDVTVVASHYETFGVVAAESLMTGTPVVATRCGGPECIVGEEDGILVPVGSVAALADALEEMARDRSAYDPSWIAERARRRFSGAAITRKLERIYNAVLSARRESMEAL